VTAETYRVIVCGSRDWQDSRRIRDRLLFLPEHATIVHGDARGADSIADGWAKISGFAIEPHPADWERHGKRAGPIRNEEMAALGADICIAFWDGTSTGTADMLKRAEAHGIPTEVVAPETAKAAADRAYDEMQWRGWDE
jgi:hypothetical protein